MQNTLCKLRYNHNYCPVWFYNILSECVLFDICCHCLLELSTWQSKLGGISGKTAKIFIRLSACLNNLLSEPSDPIDDPIIPPPGPLTVSFLSSVFQVAAKLGQLGVYLDTVLTNPPAGAVQHEIRAAGLANIPTGIIPTVGTSLSGVLQTQGLASSGPQPNTNGLPAGLKRPVQEAATVQTSVQSKLQPTQGNLVWDCSHQQR